MADYDAKRLQDEGGNNLNFVPTNFMDAQGNSKSIEVEFGKKQNTLSLEADSADIDDSTTIVKTLDGAKLKTALAVKLWNYIKGKLGFDSNTSRYGISISGTASSADKLKIPTNASNAITGKEDAGGYLSKAYRSGGDNNGYPVQYGNVFTIGGAGGSQLFLAWSGSKKGIAKIYYRNRRDVETTDGDCWSDWKALAWEDHTHTKSQISDFSHNHDDRYYTETEIDTKLAAYGEAASIDITGLSKRVSTIVLQDMFNAGKHYARWICKTAAGSANITDRPVTTQEPFAIEAFVQKYVPGSSASITCKIIYYPDGQSAPWFTELSFNITANPMLTINAWKHLSDADTVDGYHIVVGSVGNDPNTIYFF